jgi:hypothetical protein
VRLAELGRADLEDLRAAHGADALRCGPAILHRDLLRVLDLALLFALDAVRGGQSLPPARGPGIVP